MTDTLDPTTDQQWAAALPVLVVEAAATGAGLDGALWENSLQEHVPSHAVSRVSRTALMPAVRRLREPPTG